MKYRREIDGLRAVAVVPVILFHAGFTVFSGGFVGVDIFFVISGYLITTILLEERETGQYSLLGFYERRARRILPALFLIMILCLIPAWYLIPPYLFGDFARSMAYAALFVSNAHFLDHTDYFAIDAELQPLLHTWSLAVEEQFYLIFPLLLLPLGFYHKTRFLAVFGVVAGLSLALAEWGWRNHPEENFFFTPSRLWELLAGSICAVLLFRRDVPSRDGLAALGLGLIVFSIFVFHKGLPFPSLYAAVPVGGTVLIILFAGRDTVTARVLSLAPVVGIGLISYSAYLWHQPLFAFARILSIETPPQWIMVALALAALALAYLTWRFVEQPFRRRPVPVLPGRVGLFGASIAGIAGFVAFGLTGYNNEGFPTRLAKGTTPVYEAIHASFEERTQFDNACVFDFLNPATYSEICVRYAPDGADREIAVFGDSHQQSLLPAFEDVATRHNVRVISNAIGGCPHLLGVTISDAAPVDSQICYAVVQRQAQLAVERGVDLVVLVARWRFYTTGLRNGKDLIALSPAGGPETRDPETSQQVFETALANTIAFYRDAGIDVVLVNQVPEPTVNPRQVIERAMLLRQPLDAAMPIIEDSFTSPADHAALQAYDRRVLASHAGPGVHVLSVDEAFFENGRYVWLSGDKALFFDDNHLTVAGARRAGPVLAEKFDPVLLAD